MLSPTILTKRLRMRRFKETDIDMQYKILTDPNLSKYISFPKITKEEELECIKKWIKEADLDKYEKWVIELKDSNIPIGNISVNCIDKKNNYCNVGYVILTEYQNIGYATESLKGISDYLLEKYYLVECSCNELNKASAKVMEKAGFINDGYIKDRRKNSDGSYTAVLFYSKKSKSFL